VRFELAVHRDSDVVEEQLGGVLAALAEFVQHPAAAESRTVGFHQDQGDAVGALGGVGLGDKRGAELLFQVLTEREEKNSVAIASNESFSGWTMTFTDPRLCAAIVDRLTFGGNIIETGTDSYRLAHTKAAAAR
jgi:hypothetical protein